MAVPTGGAKIDWLPSDLKLPAGSRSVADLQAESKEEAGRLAIPLSLKRFTSYVEAMSKQGYMVIGGDHEAGEVDRAIRKGRDVVRFRARSTYCDRKWSDVEARYFKTGPSCPGTDKPCNYAFEGFLPPISNTEINPVEAGKEVVIQWRLKDPSGKPVGLSAMVAAQLQEPSRGAAISLKFAEGLNVQGGTFNLTIFTLPAWKGSTKIFTLILDDGTAHQARFRFT